MKKFFKLLLLIFIPLALAGCVGDDATEHSSSSLEIANNNVNLGEIVITDGKVNAYFSVKNTGEESVRLLSGETSCMCTEAELEMANGETSPRIKMIGHGSDSPTKIGMTLASGEEMKVTAIYDPMAHGPDATGLIARDIFIKTNSSKTPELRFSFRGNVVKGEK